MKAWRRVSSPRPDSGHLALLLRMHSWRLERPVGMTGWRVASPVGRERAGLVGAALAVVALVSVFVGVVGGTGRAPSVASVAAPGAIATGHGGASLGAAADEPPVDRSATIDTLLAGGAPGAAPALHWESLPITAAADVLSTAPATSGAFDPGGASSLRPADNSNPHAAVVDTEVGTAWLRTADGSGPVLGDADADAHALTPRPFDGAALAGGGTTLAKWPGPGEAASPNAPAARRHAAARSTPAARPRSVIAASYAVRPAATAREACTAHRFIAYAVCVDRECERPRFRDSADCSRMSEAKRRRSEP